jgi:hypothetical protein
MRVQQSLTLTLEGDDVAALRSLLRQLPAHLVPGAPNAMLVPFLPGEQTVDMADMARFVQRLARAVQGAL